MSIVIHGLHLPKMIGGEEAHVDIRIFSGGDVIMATGVQPYYKKFRAEQISGEDAVLLAERKCRGCAGDCSSCETSETIRAIRAVQDEPQKAPLCLSCKHGENGCVDDFATCYCPHHGYVGQKTECGEYKAKEDKQ